MDDVREFAAAEHAANLAFRPLEKPARLDDGQADLHKGVHSFDYRVDLEPKSVMLHRPEPSSVLLLGASRIRCQPVYGMPSAGPAVWQLGRQHPLQYVSAVR